jgi:Ethanolamine utilization protein EutJ (predicted chaperonin)
MNFDPDAECVQPRKGWTSMYLGLDLGTSSVKALLIDDKQPFSARPAPA